MKKIYYLILFGLLAIVACQKENIDEMTVDVIPNNPTVIEITTGEVAGRVIDENNTPIADATVRLGDAQTFTNQFGLFFFQNAQLNSQGTYVQVEKAGYFNGSRTFVPASPARQNVVVQLLEKTSIGAFQANTGGVLTVESGTNIRFQESGIVDANGNPYQGEVNVLAKRIDPLAENLSDIMPGNLTAVNEEGQRVGLVTYGMLAVELESPSGEPLQLASDKPATIRYAVPDDLLANAPATIPLWYFDEDNGLWVEDGEATLEGNVYVGDVTHFTMWNWDIPYDHLVNLTGTVINKDRDSLAGLTVVITLKNKGIGGTTITDADGQFSAPLPNGEIFDLVISYQGECDEALILYEAEIGPFEDDVLLPEIIVDLDNVEDVVTTFNISGTLVDCDGNPVWGLVSLRNENGTNIYNLMTGLDGSFAEPVLTCYDISEVSLKATNLDSFESISTENTTVSDYIDFGDVAICNGTITEESFLFVMEGGMTAQHTEENTIYRDVRLEHIACAGIYSFEFSCNGDNQGFLSGIAVESTEPIQEGQTLSGIVRGFPNPVLSSVDITFTELTTTRVSGAYQSTDSFNVNGYFSVPLSQ